MTNSFDHPSCFVNPKNAPSFIAEWRAESPMGWRRHVTRLHDGAVGLLVAYRLRNYPEAPLVEQAVQIYAEALMTAEEIGQLMGGN